MLDHVLRTSDPTLRAVFFEDASALVGLVIAFVGILLHQITGSATPDAVGSILVGIVLAVVAIMLIQKNRRFLVGVSVDPSIRAAALQTLLEHPQITSVSFLHIEYVGPSRVYYVAAVDLAGDEAEHTVARRLNDLADRSRLILESFGRPSPSPSQVLLRWIRDSIRLASTEPEGCAPGLACAHADAGQRSHR